MTDDDDQRPPRPSWADALNPVENLRALADVQQFGRRTAEEFADRVFPSGPDGRDDRGRAEPELDTLLRRFRNDAVRAADLWADLIDGAASMVGAMAARVPGARSDGAGDVRSIDVGPVAPGSVGSAVFWVHNPSGAAVDDVRPHCLPLRSHLGEEIGVDVVAFDPAALEPLPARSRCGIEVRVAIPAAATPATYVSVVLVSNVPALYLPLRVAVVADLPVV